MQHRSNLLALLALPLAHAQSASPTGMDVTIGSLSGFTISTPSISVPSVSIPPISGSTGGITIGNGNGNSNTIAYSGDQTITGGLNNNNNGCPSNQLSYTDETGSYCCPGAVYGDTGSKYCCVGADFQVATPSFASCFPFCSGSTSGVIMSSTTQQSCSTTIPLTASDYSSLASAAGSSVSGASGGSGGSSATTTGSDSSESGSSGSGSGSSSSSNSDNAAAAMVTSGPYAGALMAAGGLLLAL